MNRHPYYYEDEDRLEEEQEEKTGETRIKIKFFKQFARINIIWH
jgi:hypothetical protein